MKLKLIDSHNELLQVFQAASRMLGKSRVLFRRPTATVRDGIRHSTLDGYLKPALKRRNLHVLLKTQGVSVSLFLRVGYIVIRYLRFIRYFFEPF